MKKMFFAALMAAVVATTNAAASSTSVAFKFESAEEVRGCDYPFTAKEFPGSTLAVSWTDGQLVHKPETAKDLANLIGKILEKRGETYPVTFTFSREGDREGVKVRVVSTPVCLCLYPRVSNEVNRIDLESFFSTFGEDDFVINTVPNTVADAEIEARITVTVGERGKGIIIPVNREKAKRINFLLGQKINAFWLKKKFGAADDQGSRQEKEVRNVLEYLIEILEEGKIDFFPIYFIKSEENLLKFLAEKEFEEEKFKLHLLWCGIRIPFQMRYDRWGMLTIEDLSIEEPGMGEKYNDSSVTIE